MPSRRDIIELMRPRQWTKNLAVFAAIIFAQQLFNGPLLARVIVAFVAFGLLSSGLYALNDSIDAERDAQHPVKRERPVASGRISRGTALLIAGVLVFLGLALSAALGAPFFAAAVGYVLLQALYSVWLKHVAIVDMLVISAGFVLRAVAGARRDLGAGLAVARPVHRPARAVPCGGKAPARARAAARALQRASAGALGVLGRAARQLHGHALGGDRDVVRAVHVLRDASSAYLMMLTIPFVIYGVLRYQFLVLQQGGRRPTRGRSSRRPADPRRRRLVDRVGCRGPVCRCRVSS